MVRHVHHELTAALAWLTGMVVGSAVAVGVRGSPQVRAEAVALWAAVAFGCLVLSTLLRASRLKWIGDIPTFESAEPVPA